MQDEIRNDKRLLLNFFVDFQHNIYLICLRLKKLPTRQD